MESLQAGDYAEAFCLWRPLAMQGNSEAAFHLGWLYANGNGLRVDIRKAVYWWKRAADQGHRDAMFALALAYTNGDGIGKDSEQAIDWYLRSAFLGHEDAREIIRMKLRDSEPLLLSRIDELLQEPWLGDRVTVSKERVNLRSGPSVDSVVLKQLGMGQSLIVIDRRGDWYRILDPEDSGLAWIASWLVLNH
ncbi:MAG: SH3 domain-containing protein [Candidatus Thiodiazotropha sp.]